MITLGPHNIGKATAHALDWSRHAGIVKQVDETFLLAAAPDDCVQVFRCYFANQDLSANPQDVANTILAKLGGYRHPKLYAEVYNEIGQGETFRHIELLRGVVPILHTAGVKVCGPCWSTGDCEYAAWQAFRAANWCGLDALALHCYWGGLGFTTDHALRYRRFWLRSDPPIFITECGRDRVEGGLGGWKRDGLTADLYVDELIRYSHEIARDGALGVVFQEGSADPQWDPFDTEELDLGPLYAGGGKVGGETVPVSAPPPVGEYARWALQRIQNKEDPRDVTAFIAHLRALGAEYTVPEKYGLPCVKVTVDPLFR